jgi:hypothetical protein
VDSLEKTCLSQVFFFFSWKEYAVFKLLQLSLPLLKAKSKFGSCEGWHALDSGENVDSARNSTAQTQTQTSPNPLPRFTLRSIPRGLANASVGRTCVSHGPAKCQEDQ